MGTKQTTTGSNQSTLQFNPIAQGIYNQLVQGGGNVLSQYTNAPFSNPFYQMSAALGQKGAQQMGQNNMQALLQNMLTSGISGGAGAGFKQAQMAQLGRANQSMMSQANVSNVLAALQRQMAAAGTGLSFSPQLTGQKGTFSQTQQTSGLGTWLPQLAGGGLSAAMGFAGGGGMGGGGNFFPSVGGVSNPALGSISSIPGGMTSPGMALSGAPPGYTPSPYPSLNY